jgi:ribonuclease P protein component
LQLCNDSKFELPATSRSFTAAQRLHNKAQFDRVYRNSRRSSDAMFAVFICDTGYHTARLGLSTAARIVGGSVRRNRIKRLVRDSFRNHQHELPNVDIVVNARAGVCNADNASIRRSLERHWQVIGRRCAPS